MTGNLPTLLSGIVADAITGYVSGGAATGGAVAGITLSGLFERRLKAAQDILVEELRRGDKALGDVADLEEIVASLTGMPVRYRKERQS